MGAGNILKILVGLALMVGGVAWYFVNIPVLSSAISRGLVPFWRSLLVIFAGCFGALVFLAGLLLAWISYEDYKSSKA